MKKLLLTSAGFSNPKIGDEFLKLVHKKPADIKVLFIPTASEYKSENEKEMFYVKESEKELIDLGIEKEHIVWFDINDISAAGDLNKYDVIYVCGGNTFYLADKFKKTGFDKKLTELINAGKVYVGVSAGSVIAGPTLAISGPFDPNDVGLKDTTGLCVTDKIICPHFQRKEEDIVAKFEKKNNCKVLRLNDGQALEVIGDVSKIIE